MLTMLTCAFFQWALWSLLVAEDAWAEKQDPESCLLQHRPLPPELAPFPAPTESTQRMWTTPGVHFQQCSTRKQSPASPILALQVNDSQLPPKPTCQPGEMLIGSFENDSYVFTCCAGEECSGCSVMRESSCAQCASGFVWQTMPIVNKSRCFICDDLPEWKDAKGRTCADYESICDGGWPDLEKDKAFQGLRPSEACCTCGGGSISPTPVSLPLAAEVLFQGQAVDAYPEPSAMERVEVDAGCDLESGGLALSTSGRIHGTVHAQAIKCQITVVQDSVRGLSSQLVLDVPVHDFSYGSSVVMFKSWRLDDLPAEEATKTVQHSNKEIYMLQKPGGSRSRGTFHCGSDGRLRSWIRSRTLEYVLECSRVCSCALEYARYSRILAHTRQYPRKHIFLLQKLYGHANPGGDIKPDVI
ncbi:unnamed protein product [Symbiodinium sp. CCMP2592]|nr:unnamed protein product [Symbiodinium sp. CCMP2592]